MTAAILLVSIPFVTKLFLEKPLDRDYHCAQHDFIMRFLRAVLIFCFAGWVLPLCGHAADISLVEAGVPALSREWSGKDYAQTAGVLASGKVALPQLSDDQGRAFFQRLTSTENFSYCRNRSLPLEQRLNGFSSLLAGLSNILQQYLAAANKGANLHRELAEQAAFLLRAAAVGVGLTAEFLPTIPKDEKYATRMAGLKKFNGGLTTIFSGAETTLSEKSFYPPEDLSLLLDAMAETLPAIKSAFAPDYRIELRQKLESRRAEFSLPKDTANLQRMIGELRD